VTLADEKARRRDSNSEHRGHLIERGAATEKDIASAIETQKQGDPRHLGEILVERGAVKSHELVEALQTQQAARSMASESSIRVERQSAG